MHKKLHKDSICNIIDLTSPQLGIFYHCLKSNEPNMYVNQVILGLGGDVKIDKFTQALKRIFLENEALRSTFRWENLNNPACLILKSNLLPLTIYEYNNENNKNYDEYVNKIGEEIFQQGIKMDADTLINFYLIKDSIDNNTLIIQYHHIIMDGWSLGNLLKDLFTYYNNVENQNSTNYFNYVNYVKEINNINIKEHLKFWGEYLTNYENNIELPYVNSTNRLIENGIQREKILLELSKEDSKNINEFLKKNDILFSSFIYSIWTVLLNKYTSEEDIVFGNVVSGRSLEINGIIDAIGMFSNTIPFRGKIDVQDRFIDFLKRTNEEQMLVSQYNLAPLQQIKKVSNLTGTNELFSTLIVIENYPLPEINGELQINSIDVREHNNFPVILNVFTGENIKFEFEYDTSKYDSNYITKTANHLKNIANIGIEETEIKISDMEFVSEEEQNQICIEFNSTNKEFPKDLTVANLFTHQAETTPNHIAVKHEGRQWTYEKLNYRSNTLAAKLIGEKNVKAKDIVCILMDTSIEAILSMMGIMKSGAAFLPIDAKYPEERIIALLQHSLPSVVVTTRGYYEKYNLENYNCLFIDDIKEELATTIHQAKVNDLAYLIATSGSTGVPKCIMVNHNSFTDFVYWVREEYQYQVGTQGLLSLPFAFDSALLQIFPPLISGGTLHLIDPMERKNPEMYFNYLKDNKINVIDEIASVMNLLFEYIEQEQLFKGAELLPELNCISLGSEHVPTSVCQKAKKYLNKQGKVINAYGPAEASVVTSTYHFTGLDNEISLIGKPRANTKIYIINKYGNLLPVGVPGEICLSGICLAQGYYNDSEKSQEKFIVNPFSKEEDYGMLYKTGDQGCWLESGDIDYLGRIDRQVKINGYRIELEDIEKHLNDVLDSKNVAVIVKTYNNTKQLVAYVETNDKLNVSNIKKQLAKVLPSYMIPNRYMAVSTLPYNPNGKVDRRKLAKIKDLNVDNDSATNRVSLNHTEIEKTVSDIWKVILGHGDFINTDNFYEVGGDSISIVKMYMQLKKTFTDEKLELSDLFSYTTVSEITRYFSLRQSDGIKNEEKGSEEDKSATDENTDIAIVGIAGKLPQAKNMYEFWSNLTEGNDCISEIPERRIELDLNKQPNKEYLQWGYIEDIDYFDPLFFKISPKMATSMDPHHRNMLETSYLALENSGYFNEDNPSNKVGVFISSIIPTYLKHVKDVALDELIVSNVPANLAGRISYHMGLRGPSLTIDTACSSSLVALHYAMLSIQNKDCDEAIVGGVYLELEPIDKQYALNSGIVSPKQRCYSFADEADGTIGGEGCVAVMLKPLKSAIRDNDYIYSVIKGSAVVQDGDRSNGITAPNADAQAECIKKAWENSRIEPNTISYIETHGSATKLGDPIEVSGIEKAFANVKVEKQSIPIGCVKTNVGHLDAVAGLAGMVKTVLCLDNSTLVPSINFEKPNPFINFDDSPVYVLNNKIKWELPASKIRRAGVSSFGLSGTNCHVVLEEFEKPQNLKEEDKEYYLLLMSGNSKTALKNQLQTLVSFLNRNNTVNLSNLCYTMAVHRQHFDYRKAFIFKNMEDLLMQIEETLKLFKNNPPTKIKPVEIESSNHIEVSEMNYLQLGELYQQGVKLNLKGILRGQLIYLPNEPFEKKSYWIKEQGQNQQKITSNTFDQNIKDLITKELYHRLEWRETTSIQGGGGTDGDMTLIVYCHNLALYSNLLNTLRTNFKEVIIITNNHQGYQQLATNHYGINYTNEADYRLLYEELSNKYRKIDAQVNLIGDNTSYINQKVSNLEKLQLKLKELVVSSTYSCRLKEVYFGNHSFINYFITYKGYNISLDDDLVEPYVNICSSISRTINREVINTKSFVIDIDEDMINADVGKGQSSLVDEIISNNSELEVCYRNGLRYLPHLVGIKYEDKKLEDPIKEDGVYIITGGTGGIALELSKHMANRKNVNLYLISRTAVDLQSENKILKITNAINEIKDLGSNVETIKADVSNYEEMKKVINYIREKHGLINGVIHTAGIQGDKKPFVEATWKDYERVFEAKVYGTMVLDQLLRNELLDFFVMFSSIDARLSMTKTSSYSSANSFLDSFATMNRQLGKKYYSINWGGWRTIGMGVSDEPVDKETMLQNLKDFGSLSALRLGLDIKDALNSFEFIIATNSNDVWVTYIDDEDRKEFKEISFFQVDFEEKKVKPNTSIQDRLADITLNKVIDDVKSIWMDVLELDDVDEDESFFVYGGDSINGIEITFELSKIYGIKLEVTKLFDYDTVVDLGNYIYDTVSTEKNSVKSFSIPKAKPIA